MALAALIAATVAACSDGRPFSAQRDGAVASVEGASLVVPTTLTPPVRVEGVSGAPESWNLDQRVAESLRQRDIPAGVSGRGRATYVLRGNLSNTTSQGGGQQMVFEWQLYDPDGNRVGSVSQMAALPDTAGSGQDDDVVSAIADAAAESVSPLVPSANVYLAEMPSTGELPRITRRQVESRNPVTALGRVGSTGSPLSQNLLQNGSSEGQDIGTAGVNVSAGATASAGSQSRGRDDGDDGPVTAVGRMSNDGTLSRNLLERRPGPAGSQSSSDTSRRIIPGQSFTARTTSSNTTQYQAEGRQYADAGNRREPPAGTMEELFRQDREARSNAEQAQQVTQTQQETPAQQAESEGTGSETRQAAERTGPENGAANDERTAAQDADRTRQESTRPERQAQQRTGKAFYVQIGSYRNPDESVARWRELKARAGDVFADTAPRSYRIRLEGRGVWYRLQVGPLADRSAANAMCQDLKRNRIDCFILQDEIGRDTIAMAPDETRQTAGRPTEGADPGARQSASRPETGEPATSGSSASSGTSGDTAAGSEPEQQEAMRDEERQDEAPAAGSTGDRTPAGRQAPGQQQAEDRQQPGTADDAARADASDETTATSPERRTGTEPLVSTDGAPITTSPGLPGILD